MTASGQRRSQSADAGRPGSVEPGHRARQLGSALRARSVRLAITAAVASALAVLAVPVAAVAVPGAPAISAVGPHFGPTPRERASTR